MKEEPLANWREFKDRTSELRSQYANMRRTNAVTMPSFRGQASASWGLETTLERASHSTMSLFQYGVLMATIAPEICTAMNRRFDVPDRLYWETWLKQVQDDSYFPPHSLPGYDFMVYLRQQGFPSPLLDWTDSEFVAAYFAFADAKADEPDARVAIYAYVEYGSLEHGGAYKVGNSIGPAITGMGPYVMSHPRHFTQQARYTYCKKLDGDVWKYVPHAQVFEGDPRSILNAQDVLIKYTLPASEREEVLRELMRFNLTAYSLFATEEALMKTMAFKVL
jgi:hypothetical protein